MRILWQNDTRRETGLVGHILRNAGLVNLAIEGSVEDRDSRGGQR